MLYRLPLLTLSRYSCRHRHLAPGAAAEVTAAGLRAQPADLLEEEVDVVLDAAVADVADPFQVERAEARAAFAAGDDPVDAVEVE